MKAFLTRLRAWHRIRKLPWWQEHTIAFDDAGLRAIPVKPKAKAAAIEWSAVSAVHAFKRDLFTTDLICLCFEGGRNALEINEEQQGWTELVEALPSRLDGCLRQEEWLGQVMKPAFAANKIQIFPRAAE